MDGSGKSDPRCHCVRNDYLTVRLDSSFKSDFARTSGQEPHGGGGRAKRPFSATTSLSAEVGLGGDPAGYDSDEDMDSSNWSQKDQESLAQIEAMLNAGNLDPGQLKSLKKQRRAMQLRASATASRQRKKEYLQNLERHMSELSNSNTLLLTSVARMTEAEQAREKHNSLVSGRSHYVVVALT